MKKLYTLFSILVVSAALFTGCKKDADPGAGSGEFPDCTISITKNEIEFADGEWTFRGDWKYHGINYHDVVILSVSGGNFTATSGTATVTANIESIYNISTDDISNFDSATEDQKKQFIVSKINSEDELDMSVSTSDSITINGHNITLVHTYTSSDVTAATSSITSSYTTICNYAESIKTNSAKTKYVFDFSSHNEMIYIYKN
ncbi:MAG: hypothetical protein J6T20_06550 [Treponema sp.]|nr:hypothetical protein [Treponema sp.]